MILILGGTTEGRAAVKVADEAGKPYFYSTKGEWQEVVCKHGKRLTGGMDEKQMEAFCRQHDIRLLVDAAHPFAVRLHHTVDCTSRALGLPVVRYERRYPPRSADICWCEDYADAMRKLEERSIDSLLALTGVQTIGALRPYWERHATWFRVLEREASVALAQAQGFDTQRLVFYHPDEPETSLLEQLHPQAILTKESGETGGFLEKTEAARLLHIPVFAIKRPTLPPHFITVTGEHGLRKQIEKWVPEFYLLRSGFTTGACATAAAKAALTALILGEEQRVISFCLPDGEEMTMPVAQTEIGTDCATATVIKDAGDDPDVTNGCAIVATVRLSDGSGIRFLQGEGVGRVTLPGLGLEIGGPAINPVPRQMMTAELSALYSKGLDVTISVPGGRELAQRTFNPKLGIVDGISIIGTSGIVRPFSSEAFVEAIRREVEVCVAVGSPRLVINSGAKSERFVKQRYPELPAQAFVHYGNFIGETLKIADSLQVKAVTMGIMVGKAVKLAEGNLDTHSKRVVMNKDFLKQLAAESDCSAETEKVIDCITLARELWTLLPAEDSEKFFPCLLKHCAAHCAPLLPHGELTIMLIDEEGNIPYCI
ncbi:MAG: cobalt-precorrin-5B (C(1))-methyltransferase CbiD [Bacteroidales bacterium]|nr:cobalt-precorrin-5B (C(1))-methyltransferase CbiD [Bacteroidales bacterium]